MPKEKTSLHPRNIHRKPYDFSILVDVLPDLAPFVHSGPQGQKTIDFSQPEGVKTLNKALLLAYYHIKWWDIPENCLCPPVPGRADYVHYAADLVHDSSRSVPHKEIRVLDVGVGANCIYPILGRDIYGWKFVGSDVDPAFLASAQRIVDENKYLKEGVELRHQSSPENIFQGIIQPGEFYDLTLCNPPFHSSEKEALGKNRLRLEKMGLEVKTGGGKSSGLNFGGHTSELWCPGGEKAFLEIMIRESSVFQKQCGWFSSLVSQGENLPALYSFLKKVKPREVRTIPMAQGQKISRLVAWCF